MKLVAPIVVRNEINRYLVPFVEHLAGFCDEIVAIDDCSDDGTFEQLKVMPEVTYVAQPEEPSFFNHEGKIRNTLLDFALQRDPSHIVSLDADEFVSDGPALRDFCEGPGDVFTLSMEEVWKADAEQLQIRVDGGWRRRAVPVLYRVPYRAPGRVPSDFRIANRPMACGREPMSVAKQAIRGRHTPTGVQILHFGWTREAERQARYDRYVQHDLGKSGGHADQHLLSIMWPDSRVTLEPREWPAGLDRDTILE